MLKTIKADGWTIQPHGGFAVMRDGRTTYFPRFAASAPHPRHPRIEVRMEVGVDRRGRPSCLELALRHIDDERIPPEALKFPLATGLRNATAVSMSVLAHEGAGVFGPPTADDVAAIDARAARRIRQSRRLTDEHLEEVADVYRRALERGERPTQAVMDEWDLGVRSTSSRWVAAARQRGFLGPAQHGRATS